MYKRYACTRYSVFIVLLFLALLQQGVKDRSVIEIELILNLSKKCMQCLL